MFRHRRLRFGLMGTVALVVAIVATAFALGGGNGSHRSTSRNDASPPSTAAGPTLVPGTTTFGATQRSAGSGSPDSGIAGSGSTASGSTLTAPTTPHPGVAGGVPHEAASAVGTTSTAGTDSVASVTATRVVKTGSLAIQVARGQVQPTVSKLVVMTTALDGYVSKSRTDNILGSPEATLTLRIPAAGFETAVSRAAALGHETSLSTDAQDVTGEYVDLGARLGALKRTRSTYLTILGNARTIGETLEVQQRVNDVQQQIEELQGELKLLRNQSSDGTLVVDVTQQGSAVTTPRHRHHESGLERAWHRSIRRFNRGIDAIVGALGPLLLVLLILAAVVAAARFGYRGVRRASKLTLTGGSAGK